MPRKTKTEPQEPSKPERKPLVWLSGEVKTRSQQLTRLHSTFSREGWLQEGQVLSMPHAEPLPTVGPRCGALRVRDAGQNWRIMYRIDKDAVVILEVYGKKTQKIPDEVIDRCKDRLKKYDAILKSTKAK
jgi:phage-related protein